MFSCKCLNVTIEADDFQKVNIEYLNLADEELKEDFFKQDIQQVGKLISISKTHSGLIQTKNVGNWVIHYCINCGVYSHAVHREKGASCVLVNTKLLDKEAISRLRSSDMFSKVYNIIVNPDELQDIEDKISYSFIPSEVEPFVKSLKQIASEIINKESLAVKERIQKYTEEQYNQLEALRDRAFREQQALIRLTLNNIVDNSDKPNSTNPLMSNNPMGTSARLNEPLTLGKESKQRAIVSAQRPTPKRQKSSPGNLNPNDDGETLLFEFDSIDNETVEDVFVEEESDQDEAKDEAVGIARRSSSSRRGSTNLIAKSLPMNIPTFMSQNKNRFNEDIEDDSPQERNVDIAASIKALAKSVHGDTVFGDLPRPRFSTQI